MSVDVSAPGFFAPRAGGIELHVRLTPKSSRDVLDGAETLRRRRLRAEGAGAGCRPKTARPTTP